MRASGPATGPSLAAIPPRASRVMSAVRAEPRGANRRDHAGRSAAEHEDIQLLDVRGGHPGDDRRHSPRGNPPFGVTRGRHPANSMGHASDHRSTRSARPCGCPLIPALYSRVAGPDAEDPAKAAAWTTSRSPSTSPRRPVPAAAHRRRPQDRARTIPGDHRRHGRRDEATRRAQDAHDRRHRVDAPPGPGRGAAAPAALLDRLAVHRQRPDPR